MPLYHVDADANTNPLNPKVMQVNERLYRSAPGNPSHLYKRCLSRQTTHSLPPLNQSLSRKPQPRTTRPLKHHILALQKHIPKDINPDTAARLDPTVASRAAPVDRRVVDIRARDRGPVAADLEADVRQDGAAGICIAALVSVVFCAADAAVVVCHDVVLDEYESGACVGDALDAVVIHGAVADCVARGREGHRLCRRRRSQPRLS